MIALTWDGLHMAGDLNLGTTGLVNDDSLTTTVLVSLFTDRRARPDDPLPDNAAGDRRGWLGDALADIEGDRIGSRLWLLRREKQTDETRRRAEEYCREALAWLIDERLALAVNITATWLAMGWLGVEIIITRPSGDFETHSVRVVVGNEGVS